MIGWWLVGLAWAGGDADVTAGVAKFERSDYAGAEAELRGATADVSRLKKPNVPRAWAYLARASALRLTLAAATTPPPVADTHAAIRALAAAKASDDGTWTTEIHKTWEMCRALTALAVKPLLVEPKRTSAAEWAAAEAMVTDLLAVVPTDATTLGQRGMLREFAGDRAHAYEDYVAAIAAAGARTEPPPDPWVADDTLGAERLAPDPGTAVAHLDAGIAALERSRALATAAPPERLAAADAALDTLRMRRLSQLLAMPDRAADTRAALDAAIVRHPERADLQVVLGGMLQPTDLPAAIHAYEIALQVEPTRFDAHYNLGAIYLNRAISRPEGSSSPKAAPDLALARTHLEAALAAMPNDRTTLRGLMQIAAITGDDAA